MTKAALLPLVLLAAPALAQTSAPPAGAPPMGPPPEFIAAAQAFGQCVNTGASKLTASVAPEAGAAQVLGGCATQRTTLDTRFESWISSPSFPEAGRTMARDQYKAQMATLPAKIADGIRQGRASAANSATPKP